MHVALGSPPPYIGVRYHLSKYGGWHYPNKRRELYKLRHSSLRVTIEQASGAFKNRFRILDNKNSILLSRKLDWSLHVAYSTTGRFALGSNEALGVN